MANSRQGLRQVQDRAELAMVGVGVGIAVRSLHSMKLSRAEHDGW